MLYHVSFAADHREAIPPLENLPSVEAADPISAVESLLKSGRVPQDRIVRWARVVVSVDLLGRPTQAVRVAVTPERTIQLDWGDDTRF